MDSADAGVAEEAIKLLKVSTSEKFTSALFEKPAAALISRRYQKRRSTSDPSRTAGEEHNGWVKHLGAIL